MHAWHSLSTVLQWQSRTLHVFVVPKDEADAWSPPEGGVMGYFDHPSYAGTPLVAISSDGALSILQCPAR